MKWCIRESGSGYVAECGIPAEELDAGPNYVGYVPPAFTVYESSRFTTRKAAEQYIRRRSSRTSQHITGKNKSRPAV